RFWADSCVIRFLQQRNEEFFAQTSSRILTLALDGELQVYGSEGNLPIPDYLQYTLEENGYDDEAVQKEIDFEVSDGGQQKSMAQKKRQLAEQAVLNEESPPNSYRFYGKFQKRKGQTTFEPEWVELGLSQYPTILDDTPNFLGRFRIAD